MHSNRILFAVLAIGLAILACNVPSGEQVQGLAITLTSIAASAGQGAAPSATSAGPAAPPPTATTAPPPTAAPPTACSPIVTANMNANVRRGDSTLYDAVGYLPTGGTAPLAGRNAANTWWYIAFPAGDGGYAWIAQSVTTASCVPAAVQVVAPPPLPPTPTSPPYAFAVTNVTFTGSGTCPNFHYKFTITTNGPGTVNYHRVWSDGGTDTLPGTLTFSSAGTKVGGEYDVYFGVPGGTGWTDVYIDSPNHQQFGRFSYSCP